MQNTKLLVLLAMATTCGLFGSAVARAAPPSHAQIRKASNCNGCTVLALARLRLDESRVEAYEAKLYDLVKGDALTVTLLGNGRTVADRTALLTAEASAYRSRYGKLSPRLHRHIDRLDQDAIVPLALWTNVHIVYPPKEALLASASLAAAFADQVKKELAVRSASVLRRLRNTGAAILEDGSGSPLVRASVRKDALAALASDDDVLELDLDPGLLPTSSFWHEASRFPAARTISTGAGVSVCDWEGYRPVSTDWLRVDGFAAPTGEASGLHMQVMLATISNTYGASCTDSALTYGANAVGFVPGPGTPNVMAWCLNQGINIINAPSATNSSTVNDYSTSVYDKQMDFYTKLWPYPLFVHGSGNGGSVLENRAYNTLIVGGSDDNGTAAVSNDTIAALSGWINPQSSHSDRELPYLVAPAMNIQPTPLAGGSGTSFSTSITTGAVMLARARDTTLQVWPEMNRALFLATAIHNVDADAFSRLPATADMKDGVGLLQAAWAVDLAAPANYRSAGTSGASNGRFGTSLDLVNGFGPDNGGAFWNVTITKTGRLRAALAWDATPTGCDANGWACAQETLDADLDLHLQDAQGNYVTASLSYDSSWEAIDWPVTAGQTYRLRIYRFSRNPSQTHTYAGIAWYNYEPGTQ